MNKRKVLKEIVQGKGIEALKSPSKVNEWICSSKQGKQGESGLYSDYEIFGAQMELFLKATNLGMLLQSEERYKKIGKAGYEGILFKAAKDTGISVEEAEELGKIVLYAAGYSKEDIYHKTLPAPLKLPFLDGKKNQVGEEARGAEAYRCAKLWFPQETITSAANVSSEDAAKAFQYAKRAVLDGCDKANGLLGLFYYYGIGVAEDEENALKYLLRQKETEGNSGRKQEHEVLELLLHNQKERQKKKVFTTAFSALIFLSFLLLGIVTKEPQVSGIWIFLSVANTAAAAFFLLWQKGTERVRNIFAGSSLLIWLGFLVQISW